MKDSDLRISRYESVYYDIDKSQLEYSNKIQHNLFHKHSLVRQKSDCPNSRLSNVYGVNETQIKKNYRLTMSQRNEFLYDVSLFRLYAIPKKIDCGKVYERRSKTKIKNPFVTYLLE